MIDIKNYDEVKAEIVEVLEANFGSIDSEPDSNISQLTEPFTLGQVDVYQQLDFAIQSLSPTFATGEAQNRVFAYNGLVRQDATPTTVPLILDGTEGTVVPSGSVATSSLNGAEYQIDSDTTITKANLIQIKLEVDSGITAGATASVIINGVTYSVVAISDDPIGTAEQLTDEINGAGVGVLCDNVGSIITVKSDDLRTVYSADVVSNVTIFALGTPADSTGLVDGKISAPARSVNIITTAVTGWNSVDNLLAGQRGRDTETDEEFRERRLRSFLMAGGASILGMQAKILNDVDGVSFCRVYENATSAVDGFNRKPHTIHVVAEGGTENDIANLIAQNKSGGIDTHGSIIVNLADSEGVSYPIRFDRPVVKYAWVEVTILSKNFEETFPPDGTKILRQAVYDFASNSFGYGDDLILQKFYTPVYSVAGIKDVSIRLAITDDPNDTPVYSIDNVSIAPTVYTDWLNNQARINIIDTTERTI